MVDRKYLVSLDIIDFGYLMRYVEIVGQVELIVETDPVNLRTAHKEIDDFILEHAWFFNRENA